MRQRWEWIIGVIGLLIAGPAAAQEATADAAAAETNATDGTTKPPLTGNPQIDYIYDLNLPFEVKGYDLSDYPFYSLLPPSLLEKSYNFSCDNRLDGFYASVPHKCQVYHNCLFNQRYDFLCANYTVFDQKNFICHYASEVDCANSADHYDRNEELYVTTSTTTARPQIIYVNTGGGRPRKPQRGGGGNNNRPNNRPAQRPFGGNRRRIKTTTPAPEYYEYYDEYYDQYYDDYYYNNDQTNDKTTTTTTTTTTQRPRRPNRPQRTRGGGGQQRQPQRPGNGNVFNNNRNRPRINPPVPVDDELSGQGPRASRLQQSSPVREQAVEDVPVDEPRQDINQDYPSAPRRRPQGGRKPRPGSRKKPSSTTTTTTTEAVPENDYYDYYDYADEPSTTAAPSRQSQPSSGRQRPGGSQRRQQNQPSSTTTTTTTTEAPTTESARGRVSVRKSSVSNRRTPIEGAIPVESPQNPAPTQDTSSSQNQRPQRVRPQFPRRRNQSQPTPEELEVEIVEEAPPLAPELGLTPDEAPVDSVDSPRSQRPAVNTQGGRSRTPIRRLGQTRPGTQRSSQQSRGAQQNGGAAPDYYDY